MNAAEYTALAERDPAEARRCALALGEKAIGLAAELAASRPASSPWGSYTAWLRFWHCPTLPHALKVAGWAWSGDGTALVNQAGRLELRCVGDEAIDRALQICFGAGKIKPRLTVAEREALVGQSGVVTAEEMPVPQRKRPTQPETHQQQELCL